jgi:uncharacterized protein YggT (Ycf19 family)
MILGTLLRSFGYLLTLGGYLLMALLILEWLIHYLPGVGLNPVRRTLFRVTFPMLQLSDRYFPLALGSLNFRGLLLALVLWGLVKGFVPWVIWAGFSLPG